jgi:hypothetical protein
MAVALLALLAVLAVQPLPDQVTGLAPLPPLVAEALAPLAAALLAPLAAALLPPMAVLALFDPVLAEALEAAALAPPPVSSLAALAPPMAVLALFDPVLAEALEEALAAPLLEAVAFLAVLAALAVQVRS